MRCPASLTTDPLASSRAAGLAYVSDNMPGIRRKARGRSFVYLDPRGHAIRSPQTLRRIRALVIPPAWRDVWICPIAHGHIQATGRDVRGRKQYRYHPAWRQVRNETKFHRMVALGRKLPAIRRRLRADLRRPGLPRERVLAAVVSLLECTHIRVGNDEYSTENGSYGLTTFQDRHASVHGDTILFRYRGKSARQHIVRLSDPRLARIVRACQDIPGQELFQYVDETGEVRDITSGHVNTYLREISGDDFTAKDFRTWAGTVLFIEMLGQLEPCRSRSQAKRQLVRVVAQVAGQLRNTPAVCKSHYIHPFAIECFLDNSIHGLLERLCRTRTGRRVSTEKMVVRLLEHAARRTCPAGAGRASA